MIQRTQTGGAECTRMDPDQEARSRKFKNKKPNFKKASLFFSLSLLVSNFLVFGF